MTNEKPEQDDRTHESAEEMPSTDELQEPSTEKEPGEAPKAPPQDEPEPDHQAVGIGVVGGPQTKVNADAAESE